jgi:hypothetical protein
MYAGQNKSPFSNALGNFMQARQTAQTQRLMGPAMSGDLTALNELMGVNPQAGMQVGQIMQQRQQGLAQQQAQEQQLAQQAMENEMAAKEFGLNQEKWGMEKQLKEQELNKPKGFGFEGSGLTGQMLNLISEGERNPAVKQTPEYKLAVAQLSRAEMIPTEQGMITRPGIDIAQALSGKPSQLTAGGVVEGTEKTSPLQSEYNKKYQGLESFNKQFNSYRDLLEKLGPQVSLGPINATDATALATAYTALTAEAKNAFELGALAKDDMALIERFAPNPTELAGAAKGVKPLLGGLDQAADYFSNKQGAFESSYEGENVKRKPLTKLKKGQSKQSLPSKNKNGWALHTDAQGNKAYVGPNGEIEEVE